MCVCVRQLNLFPNGFATARATVCASVRYCETFGEKTLTDRDRLKLMEMNDNHVEYHTVKEFVNFCVNG